VERVDDIQQPRRVFDDYIVPTDQNQLRMGHGKLFAI
jgi:hypothetical protein